MSIFLWIIIVVLMLYSERELIATALTPIIDIGVAVVFIVMSVVVIVVELALIVVAPAALIFGYESREWHIKAAKKLMLGGKSNAVTD